MRENCFPFVVVQLLISEENDSATEEDYRRALELLNHVDDAIDVRHKIWCSVILRDNWTTYNINAPLNDLQNMLLFKLIDLCFVLGKICKWTRVNVILKCSGN